MTSVFGGRLNAIDPNSQAYGQLGLDFRENKFGDDSDFKVNPAISLGYMHGITPRTSLYLELAYIGDLMFGGGIHWVF